MTENLPVSWGTFGMPHTVKLYEMSCFILEGASLPKHISVVTAKIISDEIRDA